MQYFSQLLEERAICVFVITAFEKDGPLTPEETEQCIIAKAKMLGNIKFIGEPFVHCCV